MKTKFTVQVPNSKAQKFYFMLRDNEYFNFDEEAKDFYTDFVFTNATPQEIEAIIELTKIVS
jgi:hypothetical protein